MAVARVAKSHVYYLSFLGVKNYLGKRSYQEYGTPE